MISSLLIENFLSIGHIDLKGLNKRSVIGVSGKYEGLEGYSNGAGKSAVVEAILFALTGYHRHKTDAELIRIDEESCKVKLGLLWQNKSILVIERSIKRRGTGTLSKTVVIEDNNIVAASTEAARAFLERALGVTSKDFRYSFFFQQREYDILLRSRAGEALKFLEEFFGITVFEQAKQRKGKERKQIADELNVIEGSLENLSVVESVSVTKLQQQVADVETRLRELQSACHLDEEKISALDEQIKKKERSLQRTVTAQTQLSESEKSLKETAAALQGQRDAIEVTKAGKKDASTALLKLRPHYTELITQLQEVDSEVDNLSQIISSHEIRVAQLETSMENARGVISAIQQDVCPTCMASISASRRAQLLTARKKEHDAARAELKRTKEHLVSYRETFSALLQKRAEIEKNRDSVGSGKQNAEQLCESYAAQLKVLGKTRRQSLQKQKELRASIAALKERTKDVKGASMQEVLSDLRLKRNLLSESIAEQWEVVHSESETYGRLREQLRAVRANVKRKRSLIIKRRNLTQSLADCQRLEKMFDRCRLEIMSEGLKEIQFYANDILQGIGAQQREIDIKTQRETQRGAVDGIDITLTDQKGTRAIQGVSGAEWYTVAFAIRAALSQYKLARMDSKIDFLILDEVFGSLDESSKVELAATVNACRKDFAQVFAISHTDVRDLFDYNLIVVMGEDGVTRIGEAV